MLIEMQNAAEKARQLGCSATAEAMTDFAAQYFEPMRQLPPVEGGQMLTCTNQESHCESADSGAAGHSCRSIVERVSKRSCNELNPSANGFTGCYRNR